MSNKAQDRNLDRLKLAEQLAEIYERLGGLLGTTGLLDELCGSVDELRETLGITDAEWRAADMRLHPEDYEDDEVE
jgi:hypothetical protein